MPWKHIWNIIEEIVFFLHFSKTNFQLCFKHASEQILVKVWCLKYQKLFKTMTGSRFQGMYWCVHKTSPLTLFQRTVCVGGGLGLQAIIEGHLMEQIFLSIQPKSEKRVPLPLCLPDSDGPAIEQRLLRASSARGCKGRRKKKVLIKKLIKVTQL